MKTNAFDRVVNAATEHGFVLRHSGAGRAMVQCGAHGDRNPSVSLTQIETQALIHCHAGCDTKDVLAAYGLTMADLFDERNGATYEYPDGRKVHRKLNKTFPQSGNKQGSSLFRADKIADRETVYVVEGEKDVLAIESAGGVAVCSAMGAGNGDKFDWTPLRGKNVIVVADKDEPGRVHAAQVTKLLNGIAASVDIVEAAVGKDAADHIGAGKTLDELRDYVPPTDSTGSTGSAGSKAGGSEPVLDRLRNWLQRFICPMEPRDLDLLTLWSAHTHLVNETYTTPRLLIESPVPESGKTTVLEHLERFCVRPIQMATVSSPAMITRVLDNGVHTLLIDEADRSLSPDKPGIDDLIAVLNSGYKKGATRPVLVPVKGGGWDTAMMPTFAPVGMAGNQPKLPDDTLSRVIRVLIMPDHDGTVDDSDWELIEDEAKEIADALALWAEQVREQVRTGERPSLPEGAKARTKERWLPLKRVAVAAGGRWPEVVDQLVGLDLERMRLDREEGIINEKPHVVLLRNIAEVWPPGETFLPTDDVITMLKAKFPSAWGPSERYPHGLTAQRFGRMLVKNYGVYSDRTSEKVRGYSARAFNNALRSVRMPPLIEPAESVEPVEPAGDGLDECDVCGQKMFAPASIDRGLCEGCAIADKRERDDIDEAGRAS